MGHLPEIQRGGEDHRLGFQGVSGGGPSHERGHGADHGADPRVEPVHLFERSVAQRVEADVARAESRGEVVGLLAEEEDAGESRGDAERGGVTL